MSLIAKLWSAKRRFHEITDVKAVEVCATDRKSLHFEADRVRILLFRECEWRGRKLLFDSIAVDKPKWNDNDSNDKNNIPSYCINMVQNTRNDDLACEHGKIASQDVSLLSEMIFGTVAMAYRGPSFKIHAINSPGCIMCTKIFPYSEYNVCKKRDGNSTENINTASTVESSSNNSIHSTQSMPDSTKTLRNCSKLPSLKNSTACTIGSGWDIETSELTDGMHWVDKNDLLGISGGVGSFSSLRRRCLRAVSTSLVRYESDDNSGNSSDGSYTDNKGIQTRRYKTRLGLAMLLQLPSGHEEEISIKLLEHAALLEGMLDRLRYSCYECERNLVTSLYRAINRYTLRLLRLLMSLEPEEPAPLIWHDILLHSSVSVSVPVNTVFRSLQDMCKLLDDLDTKSTNFFLSTIVTAVLTYHLGWVHTAVPQKNKQLLQSLAQQYSCNPLWAQLNDLYGTLGTPVRIAHTVIAGNPANANLIKSILNFISYFLRSGLVEKNQERRCTSQTDVQEAIAIYERTIRRNPALGQLSFPSSSNLPIKKNFKSSSKMSKKQLELSNASPTKSKFHEELKMKPHCLETATKVESVDFDCFQEAAKKKIKCSISLKKNVGDAMIAAVQQQDSPAAHEATVTTEKMDEQRVYKENSLLPDFQKIYGDIDERVDDSKLETIRRQKLSGFDEFDYHSKLFNEQSTIFPSTLDKEFSRQSKSQTCIMLGNEEKSCLSIRERLRLTCNCQCSYTFTRVPSTSSELPEGILRKIIQRNFPESSKNIGPPSGCDSELGRCLKCRRGYAGSSQGFENSKLLLETPTNATEVLRGCASNASAAGSSSQIVNSNSLDALVKSSCIIELPMPRSKTLANKLIVKSSNERVGFSKSLLGSKTTVINGDDSCEIGYTWGMAVQGFTKPTISNTRGKSDVDSQLKDEWWQPIRESLKVEVKFPLIDQPVTEALCLLGDLDNWQVNVLSSAAGSTPSPVGMSRLVSNMLEAFSYLWKEFHSPEKCVKLLESRLREIWLHSETLVEFLQTIDLSDATVSSISECLDFDAADLPLLFAVASTHSPQIVERFGLALL